jgi:hypothetical protein
LYPQPHAEAQEVPPLRQVTAHRLLPLVEKKEKY